MHQAYGVPRGGLGASGEMQRRPEILLPQPVRIKPRVPHPLRSCFTQRVGLLSSNWHDHQIEIAGGRVQMLDLPPDKAKEVADLVATTDGMIYHVSGELPPSAGQIGLEDNLRVAD